MPVPKIATKRNALAAGAAIAAIAMNIVGLMGLFGWQAPAVRFNELAASDSAVRRDMRHGDSVLNVRIDAVQIRMDVGSHERDSLFAVLRSVVNWQEAQALSQCLQETNAIARRELHCGRLEAEAGIRK